MPKLSTAPAAVSTLPDSNKKLAITTVFVGNITDRASDMLIRQLLSVILSLIKSMLLSNLNSFYKEMWFCP